LFEKIRILKRERREGWGKRFFKIKSDNELAEKLSGQNV